MCVGPRLNDRLWLPQCSSLHALVGAAVSCATSLSLHLGVPLCHAVILKYVIEETRGNVFRVINININSFDFPFCSSFNVHFEFVGVFFWTPWPLPVRS